MEIVQNLDQGHWYILMTSNEFRDFNIFVKENFKSSIPPESSDFIKKLNEESYSINPNYIIYLYYEIYEYSYQNYDVYSFISYSSILKSHGAEIPLNDSTKRYWSSDWERVIPIIYTSFSFEQKNKYWNAVISFVQTTISVYPKNIRNVIKLNTEISSPDIEIDINDGILLTKKGAYSVSFTPLKKKSLRAIISELQDNISSIYNAQIAALKNTYESRIASLTVQMNKLEQSKIEQLFTTVSQLQENGWIFTSGFIYNPRTVIATSIKFKGKLYRIPPNKNFWVSGIILPLQGNITQAYAVSGFHPNVMFDGQLGNFVGKSTFPLSAKYSICLGDLEGRDIFTVAQGIMSSLQIANLDSAFSNDATNLAFVSIAETILTSSSDKKVQNYIWR